MIANRFLFLSLITFLAMLISACSSEAPSTQAETITLEVSDENCQLENIKKIEDKQTREEFGSKCFRRGEFVPSKKVEWKL
jgi:entry exclusion lipoprotein TrbK